MSRYCSIRSDVADSSKSVSWLQPFHLFSEDVTKRKSCVLVSFSNETGGSHCLSTENRSAMYERRSHGVHAFVVQNILNRGVPRASIAGMHACLFGVPRGVVEGAYSDVSPAL